MKTILLLLVLVCGLSNSLRATPNDPASPPPRFRLIFKAYDREPQMEGDYKKYSFQIDTLDLRQPSEFLKLGKIIPNTRLKLLKFVFKDAFNEKLQEKEDVSELTIINPATGKTSVLILNKVVDVSALDPVPPPAHR